MRIACSTLLVAAIAAAGDRTITASTIALWTFAEGSPGFGAVQPASILDGVGDLHGTPFGVPTYVAAPAPSSTVGLLFDGGDDGVAVPDDTGVAITASLTLEAFVRLDRSPDDALAQIIFRGDVRPGLDPYYLAVERDGRARFHIASTSAEIDLRSAEVLPLGTLIHIAGVLDDKTGTMSLLLNGETVASTNTPERPFATLNPPFVPALGIGALPTGGQHFPGIIDQVRISNSALGSMQLARFRPGDGNGDGAVTGADFTVWADGFSEIVPDPQATDGDFNLDGVVTGADYTIWADHWGEGVDATAVPEPATFAMAAFAGTLLVVVVRCLTEGRSWRATSR